MADIPLTLDSRYVEKLPAETTREYGYTHRVTVPYTQINGSGGQGDTVTLTLMPTPAKYVVERVHAFMPTAFAYASGSATLTVSLGNTSAVTSLVDARNALVAGPLVGNTVLTDSSTGAASNTLAAVAALDTSNTYADAEINSRLGVIKNAIASLAAKVNQLLGNSVVLTGTTATNLLARFTCQNTTGGEPDNISAGELVVLIKLVDLTAASTN
jgi:hypothetical protein